MLENDEKHVLTLFLDFKKKFISLANQNIDMICQFSRKCFSKKCLKMMKKHVWTLFLGLKKKFVGLANQKIDLMG